MHTRMALRAQVLAPTAPAAPGLRRPRLVETLQWHRYRYRYRYRDLDLGSQWLRDRIIGHAKGLPGVEALMG
jgi:hypothetical protein